MPIKLLIPLFRDVVGKVAPQALHRMLDIRDKQISTSVATILPPYTNTMKDSMGLPCVHVIDTYLRANAGSLQGSDAGSNSQRGGRGRGRGRGDNTAIDIVVEGMPTE
ncbi:unnamed protein product [Sphagnum balticum]